MHVVRMVFLINARRSTEWLASQQRPQWKPGSGTAWEIVLFPWRASPVSRSRLTFSYPRTTNQQRCSTGIYDGRRVCVSGQRKSPVHSVANTPFNRMPSQAVFESKDNAVYTTSTGASVSKPYAAQRIGHFGPLLLQGTLTSAHWYDWKD